MANSPEGRSNKSSSGEHGIKPAEPKGRVMVGRAEEPPVIDGKLDNPAWYNAVELTPFVPLLEPEPPTDSTRAYLSYDDDCLYAAFHNEQFVLNSKNNMLNEFRRATVENNDAGIFNDDFIAILLNFGGDTTYDIFINASGAVNDARVEGDTISISRDNGWQSNARVSAGIYEGYWVVEAAIPFSSLDRAPSAGDIWSICLGRRSQYKKESSVWHPMNVGFHNSADFGQMIFGTLVPGAWNIQRGGMSYGAHEFKAEINTPREKMPVRITTAVAAPDGTTDTRSTDYTISGTEELTHRYAIEAQGEVSFNYTIANPENSEEYYRSPFYRFRIQSSVLRAEKMEGEQYRAYINGREIKNGAHLSPGLNVLAIETWGKIKGGFKVGDHVFSTAGKWRYSESVTDNWTAPGYGTGGWDIVESSPGGSIGKEGMRGYYRKILFFNQSRFWPNWEEHGIWIAGGSIQQLFFPPQGVEGMVLNDYKLLLELPPEIEVIGASGHCKQMTVSTQREGKIKRYGEDYCVYSISINEPLIYRKEMNLRQYCSVALRLPPGKLAAGSETALYYHVNADSGTAVEVPNTLKVNILPEVKGKQPGQHIWQMWTGPLPNMDNIELAKRILANLPAYGVNDSPFEHYSVSNPEPGELALRITRLIRFGRYNYDMKTYLDQNPEHALVDLRGCRMHFDEEGCDNLICTTRILEDKRAWECIAEKIRHDIEDHQPGHMNWDYEHGPFKGAYINCFCPLCLQRFREFGGLAADAALNPEILDNKYFDQWVDFMCRRMAAIAEKINTTIKRINPGVIFSVYSGYQGYTTKWKYGVDWRYLAGKIDYAMCGYGRPAAELKDTLKAVGNTPLVLGHLIVPYMVESRQYPTYASRATLLRRALESTGGVLIYDLRNFDGRTFYASGEISRLVSDFEPVFSVNDRRDHLAEVKGLNRNNLAVLIHGETRIVILLNESEEEKEVRLENKGLEKGIKVIDYYDEKFIDMPGEIQTSVPARGVRVFIASKDR